MNLKKRFLAAAVAAAALLTACSGIPFTEKPEESAKTKDDPNAVKIVTKNSSEAEYVELKMYDQKGTGMKKPEDFERPTYYYTTYSSLDDNNHVTFLVNKDQEDMINGYIDEGYERCVQKYEELKAFAEKDTGIITDAITEPKVYSTCQNGYLTIQFYVDYMIDKDDIGYAETLDYYRESMTFDLYTGQKVETSDMYYEGVDYISYFNKRVEEEISLPMQLSAFTTITMPMKREFAGITTEGTVVAYDVVTFNKDNPYFYEGFSVYVAYGSNFMYDNSLYWVPRDMEGLLTCEIVRYDIYTEETSGTTYKYGGEINNVILHGLIDECEILSEEQINNINAMASSLADSSEVDKMLTEAMNKSLYTPIFDEEGYFDGLLLDVAIFEDENMVEVTIGPYSVAEYGGGVALCYDLDTMERLSNKEVFDRLLGDNWENNYTLSPHWVSDDETTYTFEELAADPEGAQLSSISKYGEYTYVYVIKGRNEWGGIIYYIERIEG